jgi:hypothetical protein
MLFSKYKYDVFISHAVEDKLPIANELCKRLEEAGLKVWYSGFDLLAGDSINDTIHKDLSRSRHAVVIFSQKYLAKNWTMQEYYLLRAQERAGRKVILPVLYDVTVEDMVKKDINMADKFAIPYAKGMDYMISRLLEVIKGVKPEKPRPKRVHKPVMGKVMLTAAVLAVLLAASYFVYVLYMAHPTPDREFIQQTIEQRIRDQHTNIEKELNTAIANVKASPANQQDIIQAFSEFDNLKTYYRNEYEFTNGFRESRFRKNVEKDLNINMETITPFNSYGLNTSRMFLSPRYRDGLVDCVTYLLINSEPLTYTITDTQSSDNGNYEVTVNYTSNIRGVQVTLMFPVQDFPKRYQLLLKGFLPQEKFIFHQEAGTWTWNALE